MEYYTAMKKNKLQATAWMKFKDIMFSKKEQKQEFILNYFN